MDVDESKFLAVRKVASALSVLVATLTAAPASLAEASLGFDVGMRRDEFKWHIADSSPGGVNVLSALTWDPLDIAEIRTALLVSEGDFIFDLRAAYGVVHSGDNQDSDYGGNNRTLEFSRSNNEAGGEVADVVAAIGYRFWLSPDSWRSTLSLTPYLGYGLFRQNLTMTGGYQTIPATGAFPGLHSSYDTNWDSYMGALELTAGPRTRAWALRFRYEGFFNADYTAKANWNLKEDFAHPVSFSHSAEGRGYRATLGVDYVVTKQLSVVAALQSMRWSTGPGTDTTYFSGGTAQSTRLNDVQWDSRSVTLGFVWRGR